jgi:hypothetical protein
VNNGLMPATQNETLQSEPWPLGFVFTHFLKRSKIYILGKLKFFCQCLGRSTTTYRVRSVSV